MDRRTALQSLAGTTALLGGCLSSPEAARSATPMNTDPPTDERRTVSIESVETSTHALRLNDLGASLVGSVSQLSSYSDRERKVLRQAIDGGYETSSPPEWLVEFIRTSKPASTPVSRFNALDRLIPKPSLASGDTSRLHWTTRHQRYERTRVCSSENRT